MVTSTRTRISLNLGFLRFRIGKVAPHERFVDGSLMSCTTSSHLFGSGWSNITKHLKVSGFASARQSYNRRLINILRLYIGYFWQYLSSALTTFGLSLTDTCVLLSVLTYGRKSSVFFAIHFFVFDSFLRIVKNLVTAKSPCRWMESPERKFSGL